MRCRASARRFKCTRVNFDFLPLIREARFAGLLAVFPGPWLGSTHTASSLSLSSHASCCPHRYFQIPKRVIEQLQAELEEAPEEATEAEDADAEGRQGADVEEQLGDAPSDASPSSRGPDREAEWQQFDSMVESWLVSTPGVDHAERCEGARGSGFCRGQREC